MQIYGLIPSRLKSSRLPNKPLLDIHGYPMIVHVAKRTQKSSKLDKVIVCTDTQEIADVCHKYNIETCMTSENHSNGTDRIAEAFSILEGKDDDIVIDIQGDEPLVEIKYIEQVIDKMIERKHDIVFPYQILESDNINRVKVVESEGNVLYLTRAAAPYPFRYENKLKSQLCIIGFNGKSLKRFSELSPTYLELLEGIELIRALHMRMDVGTFFMDGETVSVDVYDDYITVLERMDPKSISF